MILFEIKADGTVESTPSLLPQGYIMADMVVVTDADYALCTMKVILPSGIVLPDIIFTPHETSGKTLWNAVSPPEFAKMSGYIKYQLFLTTADGRVFSTNEAELNVPKGTISNMPESVEGLGKYSIDAIYQLLSNIYGVYKDAEAQIDMLEALPIVTGNENGQFLRVVDGKWTSSRVALQGDNSTTIVDMLINRLEQSEDAVSSLQDEVGKISKVEDTVSTLEDNVSSVQATLKSELGRKRTVAFIDHNGELYDSIEVGYNEPTMTETNPKRSGYVFTGWELDAFENGGATVVYRAKYRAENTTLLYGDPLNEALIYRDKSDNRIGAAFDDGTGNAFKNWAGVVTINRKNVHSILDKGWMILSDYSNYDIGYTVNGMEIYSKKFLQERSPSINPTAGFSGGAYARWDSTTGRWISTAVNRPVDGFNGYLSVGLLHNGENRVKLLARATDGSVRILREYTVIVND